MNSYLDARYDLVCSIIQEFFAYYDKAMTPDNDTLNAFICEQSKEIDDIISSVLQKTHEKLEEIQAICIGADSPDAIEHGQRDPLEELQCCREDLSAISNIVEELQQMLGE